MFRKLMLLAGVVGMISAAGADTIIPAGNVSGTWAAAGSPFLIMGEITVPTGQTLNIQPGVQVIFQGHYKLIVNGWLEAIGTEQDSILFTAADTSVGWWGIRFIDAPDSSRLTYCVIKSGKASGIVPDHFGGGVYCHDSNPEISYSMICNNWAFWAGGGVFCDNSSPLIKNCIFLANSSNEGGGICCLFSSNARIINCLFKYNSASTHGGGIFVSQASDPQIENTTICENLAQWYGGGLSLIYNSNITGENNIVWQNNAFVGGSQIHIFESSLIWTYCDIQDTLWQGLGNISLDPLFASCTQGTAFLSQTVAGQSQQSPCVDAGNPSSSMIVGTSRTDGVQDSGIVDMGYHYGLFPPPPPLDITLTPSNPPIVIPSEGGWFAFVITIDNNTDSTQTFDGWTLVQLPNGIPFPLIGPISITLSANSSLFRARDQYVPPNAPAGNYIYRGFVGDHPWAIADSSSFPFTKLGSNRDWLGADGWICSGEPFPGENLAQNDEVHNSSFIIHNSPNPFNPTTAISYQLSANGFVSLRVYDAAGRLVATLVDGWREAGAHEVTFDATGLAAGIYFARLEAGEYVGVEKLILLK